MAAMDPVGYLVMRAQLSNWYNLCLHGVMSSNMQEHVMSRQPTMYGSLEARFDVCAARHNWALALIAKQRYSD